MRTNRLTSFVMGAVILGGTVLAMSGCRVERTRGQRHQVRAIEAVLLSEMDRIDAVEAGGASSDEVLAEYKKMLGMYQELLEATVDHAWARPMTVQDAEDALIEIADDARTLQAYKDWHPDTQVNFERQFWRNRMRPHAQWRGPGWQTHREKWVEHFDREE